MRCLIVDKEPEIRRLIAAVPAPLAPDIVECGSGEESLAAFAAYQPDVVVMDLALGSVDGLMATRQIITADPSARVIIVTNYDGRDLREAAAIAGASDYLLKEHLLALPSRLSALVGRT